MHLITYHKGAQSTKADGRIPVVVGHGSQSMMGLSIDSNSVAMSLRTVRISKSQKNSTTRAGNNKDGSFSDSCGLIILCLHLDISCNILMAGFMH